MTNLKELIFFTREIGRARINAHEEGVKKAIYTQAQLLSQLTARIAELAGSQLFVDLCASRILLCFLKNKQPWAEATINYIWHDDAPAVTDIELFFTNDEMAYAYYIIKDKLQRWLKEECALQL